LSGPVFCRNLANCNPWLKAGLGVGQDSGKSAPQAILEKQERKSMATTEKKDIAEKVFLRFSINH